MAEINQVITLGIGTPSDIEHLILDGLNAHVVTVHISVTGQRRGERWYVCQRCGIETPESQVVVQNGLLVCVGPQTRNCRDEPGHAAAMKQLDLPRERVPDSLPEENIDL